MEMDSKNIQKDWFIYHPYIRRWAKIELNFQKLHWINLRKKKHKLLLGKTKVNYVWSLVWKEKKKELQKEYFSALLTRTVRSLKMKNITFLVKN